MSIPDRDQKVEDKQEAERKSAAEKEERNFKIGKEVAEQIWREQQLTGSRMTWNLTFQSFMLASFVLTFGQSVDATFALVLRTAICVASFVVALVTKSSVLASQEQRDYLKTIWRGIYPEPDPGLFAYPRPFAGYKHSQLGRRAPAKILSVLLFLWGFFLILAVVFYLFMGHGNDWLWNHRPFCK
jgi:hypothetical protein